MCFSTIIAKIDRIDNASAHHKIAPMIILKLNTAKAAIVDTTGKMGDVQARSSLRPTLSIKRVTDFLTSVVRMPETDFAARETDCLDVFFPRNGRKIFIKVWVCVVNIIA